MQLKFEGQTHSIDAATLACVLMQYQAIVEEANKQMSGGTKEIKLQVNAIKQGSFIVDISVVQSIIQQLFSASTMEYAASLATVTASAFVLYKKFKGRKIKTDEEKETAKTILNINDKSKNVVINIYNSRATRKAVSKSMEVADADQSVEGFSIQNHDTDEPTTFNRADFKEYIYTDFDNEEETPEERIIEKDTILTIVGLNFERNSRWQFMFDGFKISVLVKDGALMKKIDEGERFGKGDAISVKLKIQQRYNKDYRAYENTSYKIVEFYNHIIPKKAKDLFDDK